MYVRKCVCGSGRYFDFCCKPYVEKTIDDFKNEMDRNNRINAYYISIGMLSNYLIKVERDTNRVLKEMPSLGKYLLETDIKVLSERIEQIFSIMYVAKIKDDWGIRLEYIKLLVDDVAWKEKCIYYQLVYYGMNKNEEHVKKMQEIIHSNSPNPNMDVDLLLCLYSHMPLTGSITKALQILDWIENKTENSILKLKCRLEKAIRLFMVQDKDAALNIASEVIEDMEIFKYDMDDPYEIEQVSTMYEFYYNFVSDSKWLNKALEIRQTIDVEVYNESGKAMYYGNLGYLYWKMNSYHEAKKYFTKSLTYKFSNFSKLYLLDCMAELGEILELSEYLDKLKIEELGEDAFDFICILGNMAIKLEDYKSCSVIKEWIKKVNFEGNPYFDKCIKELEFSIEKRTGGFRGIINKLRPFRRYLILQPNFSGVGIDFNKMLDDIDE